MEVHFVDSITQGHLYPLHCQQPSSLPYQVRVTAPPYNTSYCLPVCSNYPAVDPSAVFRPPPAPSNAADYQCLFRAFAVVDKSAALSLGKRGGVRCCFGVIGQAGNYQKRYEHCVNDLPFYPQLSEGQCLALIEALLPHRKALAFFLTECYRAADVDIRGSKEVNACLRHWSDWRPQEKWVRLCDIMVQLGI